MAGDQPTKVGVPRPMKVILLGSSNVGKSSLRSRFIHRTFSKAYRASVGADFEVKQIQAQGYNVQLSIWDTAGQERFKALCSPFYRGSDAVLLCYSATDPKSLQSIRGWFEEFVERCPVPEDERWRYCFVGVRLKDDTGTSDGPSESDAQLLFDELIPRSTPRPPPTSRRKEANENNERPESTTIEVLSKPITRSRTQHSIKTIYHTPESSLSTIRAGQSSAANAGRYDDDNYDPLLATSPPAVPSTLAELEQVRYETPSASLLPPPSPPPVPDDPIPNGHLHPQSKTDTIKVVTADYSNDGIKHFATSAKDDRGIDELFDYVVDRVVWKWALTEDEAREEEQVRREREDAIQLRDQKDNKRSWVGRCC